MRHHNMCLLLQLLFGQFKFPTIYQQRNKKTGKIKGNVIMMMICHIFELISVFCCVIMAIVNFSYSKGPLFVLCDGSLPFQASYFKQLSNSLCKWEECMLHLKILWNFPLQSCHQSFFNAKVRCLPNLTFILSQGWIMGSKAWIHYWVMQLTILLC